MNEACLNFLGVDIGRKKGLEFAKEVLLHIRDRLLSIQQSTGNLYNLEATPAEGTAYRLAKIDKEHYPDIICANEDDYRKGTEPYYTNSSQLPVGYTDDFFQALELQDPLQVLYTGGTVFHLYLGERLHDTETLKRLVKKISESYHLPYFTITPSFSICRTHGYLEGEVQKCPHCGDETEIYSRVVGYLRPVSQWNVGKKAEFGQRKVFKVTA